MDFAGKRTDVVDSGGEVDYSNYQWFQDAPPRPQVSMPALPSVRPLTHPEPSAPQSVAPPYVPLPGVIETNSAFEFALSVAPNIVYARYKQYGQVRSFDHFGMDIYLM